MESRLLSLADVPTRIFNGLLGISYLDGHKLSEAAVECDSIACMAIRQVIIWVMKHVPPLGVCPLHRSTLSPSLSPSQSLSLSLLKALWWMGRNCWGEWQPISFFGPIREIGMLGIGGVSRGTVLCGLPARLTLPLFPPSPLFLHPTPQSRTLKTCLASWQHRRRATFPPICFVFCCDLSYSQIY